MIIGVKHTISLLKNLFIELFLNKTDKVSDISDNSVVNATAFGVAKVGQKCLKDIAIVNARIFPDTASGNDLDVAASLFGVEGRKGALGSSTFVRVYAELGTVYPEGTKFININGIQFTSTYDYTMNNLSGYGYIEVRSTGTGSATNVEPNTITSVNPVPTGHISCTNEYYAIGGRDSEDDETFRIRIKNNLNILSISTREYFTQVFQSLDSRVLKVLNWGLSENGKLTLAIVSQNGINFTDEELEAMLEAAAPYFPLSDQDILGNVVGIELRNVNWYYVGGETGVDFRIELSAGYNITDVAQRIQIAMTKYLDFRFWEPGQKIEWDELLSIVRQTAGVKQVQDQTFNPGSDESLLNTELPRIRRFVIRDLTGNIIFNNVPDEGSENDDLVPIYYPSSYAGD